MKCATYNLLENENYLRANNLTQMCSLYLFCDQMNFYGNSKYCVDCFCLTPLKI